MSTSSPPPPPPSSLPPSPPPPPPPPREENPSQNSDQLQQPSLSPPSQATPSPPPLSPLTESKDPEQNPNLETSPNRNRQSSLSPSPSPSPAIPSSLPPPPSSLSPSPSPSPSTSLSPSTTPPPEPEQNPNPKNPNFDHQPSNPDSPEPQPALPPLLTGSTSPERKPQPLPWTPEETTNLIQAYQEKWYSLKKGQLKASQWEEVAITVAARCGYDEPSKSATQCRHKIEKLRKRYRAERLKPRSKAMAWNLFQLMDCMEQGPLPISVAQPIAFIEYPNVNNSSGKIKDDDNDGEFVFDYQKSSKSKSINRIVRGGNRNRFNSAVVDRNLSVGGSERVIRGLRTPMVRKRKEYFENNEDDDEEEDNENDEEEGECVGGVEQLAAEVRAFAERFVRMENKKIEMMRDTERYRMEMENKRMEMILESQQKLVETVHKAFGSSHKKLKLAAKQL